MYCVWRAYLKGSIQVSQSRISTCENYKVQVSDQAKIFRLQKEQQLRKVLFLELSHSFLQIVLSLTSQTLAFESLCHYFHFQTYIDGALSYFPHYKAHVKVFNFLKNQQCAL